MKRYNPDVEFVSNKLTGMGGDPYPRMAEHTNGEYVRYDDICWHRNCAETPIPLDKPVLLKDGECYAVITLFFSGWYHHALKTRYNGDYPGINNVYWKEVEDE